MHTPNPVRVVRIALRLSLATAFLSAVADRFGWWEPFGQGSWGRRGRLRRFYPPACSVCFWMVIDRHCVGCHRRRSDPGSLAPDRLAANTHWRGDLLAAHNIWNRDGCIPRSGITASYSVFSAASAAAAYAILATTSPPHTTDTTHPSTLSSPDTRSRRRPLIELFYQANVADDPAESQCSPID